MGEFKVVYRCSVEDGIDQAKDLTWEHGCPLLLSALQISRDTETGQAFLQEKVQNISAKDIASFKVSFEILLRNDEKEEHAVRPLDADVVAGAKYLIKPILLNKGDVLSAKGKIEYLSFTDGEEWKSSSDPKFLPVRKKMCFTSVKVFEERQALLHEHGCGCFKKVAPYATNKGDGWIQCSCGQLNVGLDNCLFCGLFFSDIDLLEDEDNLKALAEERAARKQKEEAEKAEQKRIDAEKRAEKIEKIKSFPAKIGHGIKKEYGSHKRKKNPNKKIIVVAVVLLVGVLFATKTICFHQWQDATCT